MDVRMEICFIWGKAKLETAHEVSNRIMPQCPNSKTKNVAYIAYVLGGQAKVTDVCCFLGGQVSESEDGIGVKQTR